VTKNEILEFINKNQACHLATVEDGRPRVRGMLVYRVDKDGLVFHTGTTKDLYRQLMTNPAVEFCFDSPDRSIQVRVSGIAEISKDAALRGEIVSQRPFLKKIVDEHGEELLAVFVVKKLKASVWTFAVNLAPKEWVDLD